MSKALLVMALAVATASAQDKAFSRGDVESRPAPLSPMVRAYLKHSNPLMYFKYAVPQQTYEEMGCAQGQFMAHSSDCSKYFQCIVDGYLEVQCPNGLHWNKGINGCDWPANAGCGPEVAAVVADEDEEDNEIHDGDMAVVGEVTQPQTTAAPAPQSSTANAGLWQPQTTAAPAATTAAPFVPSGTVEETGMKVVCYFTNWAWYRPGQGKYVPEDIDPSLCTHINYGFVVLNPSSLVIKVHDPWADKDNHFFERVVKMKEFGAKVLAALGGWNDSLGSKYSQMVATVANRAKFIENAYTFVKQYGFDGIDLDWEYPVCWQTECKDDRKADKDNFSALVRELKAKFGPEGLMVTAALSPNPKIIDLAYDLPELDKYLDVFNVMAYDYYGAWDKATGHHSPLDHHPDSLNPDFSANVTMKHYADGGVTKSKLVMGMPTYGRAFTLSDASKNGVSAKATKGTAGQYTREGGFVSFYEICNYLKDGYTVVQDPEKRIGPYAYKGKQWVGYDDVAMIEYKSKFIKDNGYGGGMIWALDLDDFKGEFCGCGKYPLLTAINRVLRNYNNGASGQCNPGYQSTQAVFYNAFLPQYQQYSPVVPVVYTYPWQYGK